MAAPQPPAQRYLPNEGPLLTLSSSPREIIISTLNKLITSYSLSRSSAEPEALDGIFAGPTSIAYLLFKLAQPGTGYEDISIQSRSLAEWGNAYLKISKTLAENEGLRPNPPEARHGILAEKPSRLALSAAFQNDTTALGEFLDLLPEVLSDTNQTNVATSSAHTGTLSDHEEGRAFNEHIYGRTGYLYLLRLIQRYNPSAPIPSGIRKEVIGKVFSDTPAEWKFVNRYYLGAGHGWMNIITQILLSDRSYAEACRPLLEQILDEQITEEDVQAAEAKAASATASASATETSTESEASTEAKSDVQPAENPADLRSHIGNWDGYLSNEQTPRTRLMLQWGHGAPGIVISLMSLREIYSSLNISNSNTYSDLVARIDKAIAQAQDLIYAQGILTKESCLCHGAAGNSLALKDAVRKEHFLVHSTEESVTEAAAGGKVEASSSPFGLFRGLAGRIWAFYVFESGLELGMAGYNDI